MINKQIKFNIEYFIKEEGENLKSSFIRNFNELPIGEFVNELTDEKKLQNHFINKYKKMIQNIFFKETKKNYGILNTLDLKIYYLGLKDNFNNFFEIEGITFPEDITEWFIQIFAAIAMSRCTEKYITNKSLSVILHTKKDN